MLINISKNFFSSFFLFLWSCFFYSQNILVEYQFSQNGGDEIFVYNQYLISKGNESFFIMPFYKKFNNYEELLGDKEYNTSYKYNESIYRKQSEDVIYEISLIPEPYQEFLTSDKISHKYEILKNQKEVFLNYKCNIARLKFRGRNYKIWFTPDVPSSIGPWKFFGLPGLILKVEDEQKLFVYSATKVLINKPDFILPQKIKNKFENLSNAISYNDYINMQNKSFLGLREKALASLPKNIVIRGELPNLRSSFQEVEFEWEETKKP